jgi:hypothetical protein
LNEKRLKFEAKSENNVVRFLFQQNGKSFRINEKKDYILLMTESRGEDKTDRFIKSSSR